MKNYRSIKAWEKAYLVTLKTYALTRNFPKEETYCLTSQMRRSAGSIPTNIAEGCGRNSDPELARFFEIAMGSSTELDYLLFLAKELGYIGEADYQTQAENLAEVQRMIAGFIRKVRSASSAKS